VIKPVNEHWFDPQERDMATQYDIVHLARVGSTQDEARIRFDATGIPVLVIAGEQDAGRGRQGREWTQPDRGMFASYAFASDWDLSDRTLIPLVAAVAMREAVQESFDIALGLRWPNDLIIEGDKVFGLKVGGLLVETSGDAVVVGCGVNVWWDDPMGGAASLLAADPGDAAAARLAEAWTGALIRHLGRGSERWPRAEYESASVTLGRVVSWDNGHGRAVGIADDGALVVENDTERIELRAGEVHTRDGR
jgi:BirA family biotin operon repressor/biotin-[acetyl-CoA-carboxylase] ligase